MTIKVWVFTLIIVVIFSCKSINYSKKYPLLNSTYCYPDATYKESVLKENRSYDHISDINLFLKSDTLLLSNFTANNIRLANAIGILPVLKELTLLNKSRNGDIGIENRIKFLEKRQLVVNRLLLALTVISSVAAELDCEGERAEQIASFMDKKESEKIKKLTLLAVVLGATANIAAVLSTGTFYDALAISGGISSALLALVTLYPNGRVEYIHNRNLLSDIWFQNKKSEYYPSFIWYIFTDKSFNLVSENIIFNSIKKGWEKFGTLGEGESKKKQNQVDLFFGKGGWYTADNLHARADMINQLQSAVRLIDQDIQSLIIAVSR